MSLLLLTADFTSFTSLTANGFTGIANAFALIWLGLTNAPDIGRDGAYQLLVDTYYADPGGFGSGIDAIKGKGDASGWLHLNRVRIAYLDNQVFTHFGGAITDAVNFQLFCIASRHSHNHIVDKGAIETMYRLMLFAIRGA